MVAGYMPSYFQVHIPTDLPLDSPATLPVEVQGLFFHEYLHYLQNITTTSGLSRTWQTYDRIRQVISKVQHMEGEIVNPLPAEVVKEERIFWNVMKEISGGKDIPIESQDTILSVREINLVESSFMQEAKPDTYVPFVQLKVENTFGQKCDYWLGETAISESMVYLAERKFFDLPVANPFPYEVARYVAEFLLPEAAAPEILFTLCDISLMHPYPGFAFYTLLTSLRKDGVKLIEAEILYDFGYRLFSKLRWNFWGHFRDSSESIQRVLDILYNHEVFEDTKVWLQTIIELGCNLRQNSDLFLLNIFRDDRGLGRVLGEIKMQVGGPNCINNLHDRYMSVPAQLTDHILDIHPSQLIILWQLHDFLLMGTKLCRLIDICRTSKPPVPVDENCKISPWERSKSEPLCPYGAAWRVYGFDKLKFVRKEGA